MAVVGTDTTVADAPSMYCEGGPEGICPSPAPEGPLAASVFPLIGPSPGATNPPNMGAGDGAAAPPPELALLPPKDAARSAPPLPCSGAPLASPPPPLVAPDAAPGVEACHRWELDI